MDDRNERNVPKPVEYWYYVYNPITREWLSYWDDEDGRKA